MIALTLELRWMLIATAFGFIGIFREGMITNVSGGMLLFMVMCYIWLSSEYSQGNVSVKAYVKIFHALVFVAFLVELAALSMRA